MLEAFIANTIAAEIPAAMTSSKSLTFFEPIHAPADLLVLCRVARQKEQSVELYISVSNNKGVAIQGLYILTIP